MWFNSGEAAAIQKLVRDEIKSVITEVSYRIKLLEEQQSFNELKPSEVMEAVLKLINETVNRRS